MQLTLVECKEGSGGLPGGITGTGWRCFARVERVAQRLVWNPVPRVVVLHRLDRRQERVKIARRRHRRRRRRRRRWRLQLCRRGRRRCRRKDAWSGRRRSGKNWSRFYCGRNPDLSRMIAGSGTEWMVFWHWRKRARWHCRPRRINWPRNLLQHNMNLG